MTNYDKFTQAYIQALLWSTTGTTPDGEEVDSLEGFTLSIEAYNRVKIDCESFLLAGNFLLNELPLSYAREAGTMAYAGHDFWLTRCGHGAGFWDRGLGALGDQLTALAGSYGNLDPYIGDDGLIYF